MDIQSIKKHRQKGLDWLLAHLNEDGSFNAKQNTLSCYTKAPLALMKAGKNEEAMRILDWQENNYLRENGDLRTCDEYKLDPSSDSWERHMYNYYNGWFVVSAHLNGRFGLANSAVGFLLTNQSKNGGFYANRIEGDFRNLTDVASTSSAALALLYTGKHTELLSAMEFLVNIFDCQKQEKMFFLFTDDNGILVEEVQGQSIDIYAVDPQKALQNYWVLGFAGSILAQVSFLTGITRYLDYAKRYIDFLLQCHEGTFASFGCWKQGWACSVLYKETGEAKYKDKALEVIEYVAGYQDEDGAWRFGKEIGLPEDKDALVFDLTSEMVFWLNDLPRYLM